MPAELRKRKAAEPVPAPPAKKKNPVAKAVAVVKEAVAPSPAPAKPSGSATGKVAEAVAPSPAPAKPSGSAAGKVAVGEVINLEGFGGEVETNDGIKTNLKKLVEESKGGVVLFTYPKASTPGCTKQACLFRDSYAAITAAGFSVFGLSTDSPKSNTNFKDKQKLQYTLLCDPKATLISAIGLKKSPSGTTRGVFVVDKAGKVHAAEPGSPDGTLSVVMKLVGAEKTTEAKKEDAAKAAVAAEVATTAAKLDSSGAAQA